VSGDREWSSSQLNIFARRDSDCDLHEDPHFKQIQGLYKMIEELIVRSHSAMGFDPRALKLPQ
jgi:hypothetical protein